MTHNPADTGLVLTWTKEQLRWVINMMNVWDDGKL